MSILNTGNTFSTGDQVTAASLNKVVNDATFASGAVDGATTILSGGKIAVKDGGVTAAKLESASNGQLLIGNGSGFTKATLTAGTNIAVTNASGAITVATQNVSNRNGTTSFTPLSSTVTIDLADLREIAVSSLSGDVTFETSNRAAGRSSLVIISAGGSTRNLTWPVGWVWTGAAAPATLASGKSAVLVLLCTGSAESNVYAVWSAQP